MGRQSERRRVARKRSGSVNSPGKLSQVGFPRRKRGDGDWHAGCF